MAGWGTLAALAWAGPPLEPSGWKTIDVTYVAAFDLQGAADSLCSMTKLCDCTMTLRGSGAVVSASPSVITFQGTMTHEGTCHESLRFWVPADGKAFHTLRLTQDRSAIAEWIAHGDAGATTRLTADIKAGRQVWLADLGIVPDGAGAGAHHEQETGAAGSLPIASTHTLTLKLGS